MAKRGLGKGLDALFLDNAQNSRSVLMVPIEEIMPDRAQPREYFDEEALGELAASIEEHGILQPILLRTVPGGGYRIVAGERRYRAARKVGLTAIPAIVRDFGEIEAIEAALVENLQRADLDPIEEAKGYHRLIEVAEITQEEAAKKVGKSRSAVANALRLLSLPPEALRLLQENKLSVGHAKVLLSFPEDQIDAFAARVVSEGLSVRKLEHLAKDCEKEKKAPSVGRTDPIASEVALALRDALGVEVHVRYREGKGRLSVDFYSKEQLIEFANRLGGEK